jgi:Ca2+-binding RTX toxin-like protein
MLQLVKIRFNGTNGDDKLIGNIGRDELNGFLGNDRLWGRAGADTIGGGPGNDTLMGGTHRDRLLGNTGDDILNGRFGNDRISGGAGFDTFVFNTILRAGNADTITDFDVSTDAIDLENAVIAGLGAAGVLAPAKFHIGAAAHDATDRIVYDPVTGALHYDADGDGGAAQVQFAILTAGLALTNADFFVI